MKILTKQNAAALILCGSLVGATSARADVLYSNGQYDGTDAYSINNGYQAADSFVLSSASNVNGIGFVAWNNTSDQITAVDWSILSGSPGDQSSSILASGTANVTNTYLGNNTLADLNSDVFSIPAVSLNAGTYWVELQNAASSSLSYWDVNSLGGSSAWTSDGFVDGSNTFEVYGTVGTSASVAEPASLALVGAGLLGLLGLSMIRCRRARDEGISMAV